MKTKKIFVVAGVLLLMSGIAINVKNALNEYGLPTASLHPNVQAQVGGVNGTTTGFGEQLDTQVKCTRETYIYKNGSTSTTVNSGGSISGSAGIGGPGWGVGVGGTGNSGTTTSTDSSHGDYQKITEEFTATKYYCGNFAYVKVCTITNPCYQ